MTSTRSTRLRKSAVRSGRWQDVALYKVLDAETGLWLGDVVSSQTSTTALLWTATTRGGSVLGTHETRRAAVASVARHADEAAARKAARKAAM